MKELINGSKKMDNLKHEDFTKELVYMNSKSVESCQKQLQIRLKMMETFKDTYRSKNRTLDRVEEDKDPGLQCGDCGQSRDTQSHCMVCSAWAEARQRLDLACIFLFCYHLFSIIWPKFVYITGLFCRSALLILNL